MNRSYLLALALVPLLLASVGCGSPEAKLYGKWEGALVIDETAPAPQSADNPFAAALGAAARSGMQNMLSNLKPYYVFNADKTFSFEMASPMGTAKSTGTWEVVSSSGNQLTVRLNPTDNATIERAITFTDADHFHLVEDRGQLNFSRVTQ